MGGPLPHLQNAFSLAVPPKRILIGQISIFQKLQNWFEFDSFPVRPWFCMQIHDEQWKFEPKRCQSTTFPGLQFLVIFGEFPKVPPFELSDSLTYLTLRILDFWLGEISNFWKCKVAWWLYFSRPRDVIPSISVKFQLNRRSFRGVPAQDRHTDTQTETQTDSCALII